jgi:hypothetical protein
MKGRARMFLAVTDLPPVVIRRPSEDHAVPAGGGRQYITDAKRGV